MGSNIQGAGKHLTVVQLETAVSTPDSSTTAEINAWVPSQNAQIVEATLTVTSPGTVTNTGDQTLSLGDGTTVALATASNADATSAAGTIITFSGINTARATAAGGTKLVLTNTEAGTVGDGLHGSLSITWAL